MPIAEFRAKLLELLPLATGNVFLVIASQKGVTIEFL